MARKRRILSPASRQLSVPPDSDRFVLCPRKPRQPAPLRQSLQSELDPEMAVTRAELEATERLLGTALALFLDTKS
jgi:hypothetical protein